jgi:hypothetical protein
LAPKGQIAQNRRIAACINGNLGHAIRGKYKKNHIMAKDVVGLLVGEVVSMKKKHIVTKDVVGLAVGDSKNDREFD